MGRRVKSCNSCIDEEQPAANQSHNHNHTLSDAFAVVSLLLEGLCAVILLVNVLAGRGHPTRHQDLWPSVVRPSNPS